MTSQPQCQDMCQTPCMQMTLQYGALKNIPPQQSTISRIPSTRCAAGPRAGHYSSTQPRRSAHSFTLSTAKEKVSLRLNNQPVPQVETPTFLGVTLDTRLMWKPHLEAVEAKATRKLAIMKKLAGTTWGANSDILKQVYIGAVRPVVKYASTIWDTASKTNKSKLDRVQNMGLRIILGAMRSTPIQQMEKTTDLQPLECRREYKAAIQGEKLKRLTSHPLHQKLQLGTKNRLKRKSFKHKLKDLQKENADLLEADPGKCEELTMSVWASRKSLPEVRTEIPGLAAKGTQAPGAGFMKGLQDIGTTKPIGPIAMGH